MSLLRRLLAFLTRHQSQRSNSRSTQEALPGPPAAQSTSMFHGVGTVTIVGGTFIVIGKFICAPLDKYQTVPAADPDTPTSNRQTKNIPSAGTQTDERRLGEAT